MEKVIINTKNLGEINFQNSNGLFEEYQIFLDNKNKTISLHIFENFINENNIEIVKKFIENIEVLYKKSKETIFLQYENNSTIKFFIDYHIEEEEWEEDTLLNIFEVSSIKEINKEVILNHLELINIIIWLQKDGIIQCTLDFSLSHVYSDELLVMTFSENLNLVSISHES